MADNKKMEDDLMKHLSDSGMDKDMLKQHSAALASLSQRLKVERIYWKGIPWPEILTIQGRVSLDRIVDLKNVITPKVHRLDIFPLGVPVVEDLQVDVNIQLTNSMPGR